MNENENVEFWFNTSTGQVEVGPQSLSIDRIGPFATRELAENALESIRRKAAQLRREDEDLWRDG